MGKTYRAAVIFAALILLNAVRGSAEDEPSLLERETAPYEAEFASLTLPELMRQQKSVFTAEILEVEPAEGEYKLPLPHYETVYYDDGSDDYVLIDEPTEFWSYSGKAVSMKILESFFRSFVGDTEWYVRPVLINSYVNSDTGEEITVRRDLPEVKTGDRVLVFECSEPMKSTLPTYIIEAHGGAAYVPYRLGMWNNDGDVLVD